MSKRWQDFAREAAKTTPTTPPLRFRPHHFLCTLGFQGKGYNSAFTANMARVVTDLNTVPHRQIEVTAGLDTLCGPCPNHNGKTCGEESRIARLDNDHARALGLHPGQKLSWAAARTRIRERVQPGDLSRLCEGCQWLSLGACEAALRALHDE
jgi:uncharacterized protein